jgi:hypothetical protein
MSVHAYEQMAPSSTLPSHINQEAMEPAGYQTTQRGTRGPTEEWVLYGLEYLATAQHLLSLLNGLVPQKEPLPENVIPLTR